MKKSIIATLLLVTSFAFSSAVMIAQEPVATGGTSAAPRCSSNIAWVERVLKVSTAKDGSVYYTGAVNGCSNDDGLIASIQHLQQDCALSQTGNVGPGTARCLTNLIVRYQANKGLSTTGNIGTNTSAALTREASTGVTSTTGTGTGTGQGGGGGSSASAPTIPTLTLVGSTNNAKIVSPTDTLTFKWNSPGAILYKFKLNAPGMNRNTEYPITSDSWTGTMSSLGVTAGTAVFTMKACSTSDVCSDYSSPVIVDVTTSSSGGGAATGAATGLYVGYKDGVQFDSAQNVTKDSALSNCLRTHNADLTKSVRCVWSGADIYTFNPSGTNTTTQNGGVTCGSNQIAYGQGCLITKLDYYNGSCDYYNSLNNGYTYAATGGACIPTAFPASTLAGVICPTFGGRAYGKSGTQCILLSVDKPYAPALILSGASNNAKTVSANDTLSFSWSSPSATSYKLKVDGPGFAKDQEYPINGTSWAGTLSALGITSGSAAFSLSACNVAGTCGDYGNPVTVTIPVVAAPTTIPTGVTLSVNASSLYSDKAHYAKTDAMNFTWSASGATSYQFTIDSANTFTRTETSTALHGSDFGSTGYHQVQVRACNSVGCTGPSLVAFTLMEDRPTATNPVLTMSPNKTYFYKGDSLTFTWSGTNATRFEVSVDQTAYPNATSPTTLYWSSFAPGYHQAQVRACNSTGCSGPALVSFMIMNDIPTTTYSPVTPPTPTVSDAPTMPQAVQKSVTVSSTPTGSGIDVGYTTSGFTSTPTCVVWLEDLGTKQLVNIGSVTESSHTWNWGPQDAARRARVVCDGVTGEGTVGKTSLNSVSSAFAAINSSILKQGAALAATLSGAMSASASAGPCVDLTTDMHRGNEAGSVSALQNFLINKGLLSEKASGFFGDLTIDAVKAYQKSVGLPQTGMVYGATREAIMTETCQ